jgi:hypothetical protein
LKISETHPEIIYLKWDFLAELLGSDNHFHRYIAINLLANLVSIDRNHKFNKIFDKYFNNIRGDRTMVAGQTALNSGKIAKEKPDLRPKITEILLNIDKIHQGKQIELMKAYAINAFNTYYKKIEDKEAVLAFVRAQLTSASPKTKKVAKEFLNRWNH